MFTQAHLNPLQIQILSTLFRFRFLTSHQLTTLLSCSPRLTNYHLKQLTSKKLIRRIYSRKPGEGNKPAIYHLKLSGSRYVDGITQQDKQRIQNEHARSSAFIARTILLAEVYLALASLKLPGFQFLGKTELLAHDYLLKPLPDGYFIFKTREGETRRFFIELVNEMLPRFILKTRLRQYARYEEGDEFTEATGHDFPTILFVCPTPSHVTSVNRYKMFFESDVFSILGLTLDDLRSGRLLDD